MKIFTKIMLSLYSFLFMTVSAFFIWCLYVGKLPDWITSWFYEIINAPEYYWWMALFSAILAFGFFFIVFLLSFRLRRDRKTISHKSSTGEVHISLGAIESVSLAAIKKVNGIKETRLKIIKEGDKVSAIVRLTVLQNYNMPSLSNEVQENIIEAVREITGIQVKKVVVKVSSVIINEPISSTISKKNNDNMKTESGGNAG